MVDLHRGSNESKSSCPHRPGPLHGSARTEIESDYRRWREFDKSPRHCDAFRRGVIELMPTSDGRLYRSSMSMVTRRIPLQGC